MGRVLPYYTVYHCFFFRLRNIRLEYFSFFLGISHYLSEMRVPISTLGFPLSEVVDA